jgi:predicted alpha/beta-fold hydrolase
MVLPPFRPHPLIRGGHAQTVAGVWWPGRLRPYAAAPHQVRLDDGDIVVLHDDKPAAWTAGGPVALLVHGLAGCHLSPYMVRIAEKLNAAGVRSFRLDLRDCGAGQGLARQPYHAGRSDDVLAALRAVTALCADSDISLVGFSLGGNLVLKLLGETPDALPSRLARAMAVNPAIDLAACAQAMQARLARHYDRHLVGLLWRRLQRRSAELGGAPLCDFSRTPRALIEFDELFTARAAGFESAQHYYARSSAAQFLPNIRVPTLVLTAQDDPMVPGHIFQRVNCSLSVTIHVAEGGGHLGYIGRRGVDPDRRWMDWRVVEWVTAAPRLLKAAGVLEAPRSQSGNLTSLD